MNRSVCDLKKNFKNIHLDKKLVGLVQQSTISESLNHPLLSKFTNCSCASHVSPLVAERTWLLLLLCTLLQLKRHGNKAPCGITDADAHFARISDVMTAPPRAGFVRLSFWGLQMLTGNRKPEFPPRFQRAVTANISEKPYVFNARQTAASFAAKPSVKSTYRNRRSNHWDLLLFAVKHEMRGEIQKLCSGRE